MMIEESIAGRQWFVKDKANKIIHVCYSRVKAAKYLKQYQNIADKTKN